MVDQQQLEALKGKRTMSPGQLALAIALGESALGTSKQPIPKDTVELFENRGLRFDPITYYLRANIKGDAGKVKYLKNTLDEEIGITNFNKGELDKHYNLAVESIRVAFFAAIPAATETDPRNINGYSPVVSKFPPALRNAELVISQDSIIKAKIPIVACGSEVPGDRPVGMDAFTLSSPFILLEKKRIEVEVEYPSDTNLPSDRELFLEILLNGTQSKPAA